MSEPRSIPSAAERREDDALAELRREIDAVDALLLENLNRRAELVRRVGAVKRSGGRSVYHAARERDLIARLSAANPGPFPRSAIAPVFREIISATYALESPLRVAYLGAPGTFSHLAARESFGSQVELVGAPSVAEALALVERGAADLAVVPVENTSEGAVTQTLDALLESPLALSGESQLRISQHLLSRAERLEDVRRVVSHPQALAQCRAWLDRHLPGAERVEVPSTTAAAELARDDAQVAAIGSRLAAELAGISVLAQSIEDRRDNTTRFLIVGGDPPPPSGNDLTTVAFTVRKGESGALHRLLEPFARNGVNLSSIQARPLKGAPWEYVFFIDVEGHRSQPEVERACREAAAVSHSHRVLGSFPRATQVLGQPRPAEGRST